MRSAMSGLGLQQEHTLSNRDLVAYWKFDEPSDMGTDGRPLPHMVAKDASGNGNNLPLITPPQPRPVTIVKVSIPKSGLYTCHSPWNNHNYTL